MRTLDQQMYDVEDLSNRVARAADYSYLPSSKDELQIKAICQLTLAVLMLTEVLTEEKKNETFPIS